MNRNGFTLIEMLIVVAIMGLLVGGAATGYIGFNNRQKLISAGQTLKNTLRDAQSRAFNGEKNCTSPLIGWNVDLTNRSLYGICGYTTPTPMPTITFVLPPNITIVATPAPILFTSFPKGANMDDTICLNETGLSNKFYKLTIQQSGNIIDYSSNGLVSSCP